VTLRRYVAEEIALDCQEGLLTRREAMRRLGLLGLTAAAATSLLAACGGDDEPAATPTTQPGATSTAQGGATSTSQGGAAKAKGEDITFTGRRGQLRGSWAAAGSPRGAVLVIHENRGLTDHIKTIPPRLAGAGYSAIAIDLLSDEGGTAGIGDEGKAQAALTDAPEPRFIDDMKAGLDELLKRTPGKKLGIVGFCFGGGLVWRLLNAGEPRLAAAVPFYGPTPTNPDFSRSKAAVLAVYAEMDARVNGTRDAAKAALEKASLVHEIRTFPGVDHAFFNDTGARYNAAAAAQANDAMLAWFGKHLA
jgi:carboxymethylenebutenolidase